MISENFENVKLSFKKAGFISLYLLSKMDFFTLRCESKNNNYYVIAKDIEDFYQELDLKISTQKISTWLTKLEGEKLIFRIKIGNEKPIFITKKLLNCYNPIFQWDFKHLYDIYYKKCPYCNNKTKYIGYLVKNNKNYGYITQFCEFCDKKINAYGKFKDKFPYLIIDEIKEIYEKEVSSDKFTKKEIEHRSCLVCKSPVIRFREKFNDYICVRCGSVFINWNVKIKREFLGCHKCLKDNKIRYRIRTDDYYCDRCKMKVIKE